jgi:hypothetical protein
LGFEDSGKRPFKVFLIGTVFLMLAPVPVVYAKLSSPYLASTSQLGTGITMTTNKFFGGYVGSVTSGTITKISASMNAVGVSCQPSLSQGQSLVIVFGPSNSGNPSIFASLAVVMDCVKGSSIASYKATASFGGVGGFVLPITIKPGDQISASITLNLATKNVMVKLTDLTSGKSASHSAVVKGAAFDSAGWEMGVDGSIGSFLAKFTTPIKYSGCSVVDSGTMLTISQLSSVTEVTFVDSSGHTLAQPTALSSTGNSFKVNWVRST